MNRRSFLSTAAVLPFMTSSGKAELQSAEQMKKSLEYSWMNLGDISNVKAKDIFSFYKASEPEKTCFEMLKLFANPEYFYFTVKHIFNIELLPFQCVILKELWYRPFPMLIASRGGSKTFLLSLYAMLRSFLRPGRKIVVVGGAFRQSKYLFEYCKTMWDNAPLLRDSQVAGNIGRPNSRTNTGWFQTLGIVLP